MILAYRTRWGYGQFDCSKQEFSKNFLDQGYETIVNLLCFLLVSMMVIHHFIGRKNSTGIVSFNER